jgi:predicted permease
VLTLFSDNLLPVFLAAGAGWLLKAMLDLDPRPVARTAFYIFAPCLIFRIIVDSEVPGDALARMAAFATISLLAVAALAAVAARLMGCSRTLVAATFVVVLLPNAGNYGLSVNLFAFGEPGLAQAGVFFVTSAILTFTVGVFVASLGRTSLRTALARLPRVPTVWAVVVALVMSRAGWSLPIPVDRTVELLSQASIPVFLIVLGMQLHGVGLQGPYGPVVAASAMRLVGGALAAFALTSAFGLEGTARQAGVLQSAMPSAVICIVIASEYDAEPAFVTSVVVLTTVLSPVTLTPILAFLGAG